MFKNICLILIKIYQKTISPDHGLIFKNRYSDGFCQFQPTCSQYTYLAIERYGALKGGIIGLWRILRCNPWSKGGEDPLK